MDSEKPLAVNVNTLEQRTPEMDALMKFIHSSGKFSLEEASKTIGDAVDNAKDFKL